MTDLDEAYELSEQAEKEKHDAKVKELEAENAELQAQIEKMRKLLDK